MTWTLEKIEELKRSENITIVFPRPFIQKDIKNKVHKSFGIPDKLENLKRCQCHFPVEDGLFCGAPVKPSKSYCEGHYEISYIKKRKRVKK